MASEAMKNEAEVAAKLGEPGHDPNGSPIPGPDLRPPSAERRSV